MDIAYQREIKRVCPTHSGPGRMSEPALFPQKHRVAPGPCSPADSVTISLDMDRCRLSKFTYAKPL